MSERGRRGRIRYLRELGLRGVDSLDLEGVSNDVLDDVIGRMIRTRALWVGRDALKPMSAEESRHVLERSRELVAEGRDRLDESLRKRNLHALMTGKHSKLYQAYVGFSRNPAVV